MVPNKRIKLLISMGAAIALLGLAACGPAANSPAAAEPTQAAPAQGEGQSDAMATSTVPALPAESYPAPTQVDTSSEPYPPPPPQTILSGDYPAPTVETFLEPRFRFDTPLASGATVVTGQAPPDVALAVLDVTYNGALLGTGRSDADGRFSINVAPLPGGNRIGLTIGELANGQTLNQMAETYFPYRGDGFMNLPNIGILFETALVDQ